LFIVVGCFHFLCPASNIVAIEQKYCQLKQVELSQDVRGIKLWF